MKYGMKSVRSALFVLLALFWALLFFLPMPRSWAVGDETYRCVWADGTETEESYFSAYSDLVGMNDGGELVLGRGDLTGVIAASEACQSAFHVFENGGLGDLLQLNISAVTRLERAALYRRYQNRLWYADEYFAWSGEALQRTEAQRAETLVLLAGDMTATRLIETQAERLFLRADANFSASVVEGTAVKEVLAEQPYSSEGNTVCLSTPGGVRLLAGLPAARTVTVPERVYFADEGALLPCTQLEAVEIPFAGSAQSSVGTLFRGEFAHLFSTGKEYRVPETLKRVRVKGGYLIAHAFYSCKYVEEIDACGVSVENIERDAFVDCTSLKLLHTPRENVRLQGNFTKHLAPCGCTIYERAD